ncbi:ABC transporter permease DevC [Cognatiyoonia sp. IB215182]|uniref:ABC transporter permease DevC n=1 Tax=Cognatiyoonia sp. IB215182 TaxID=3097353 RepID=UPI002A11E86D|nr:ABC transporter permease DevC [Cognatiyoonia sp. IB215182]MDX8354911.1 ABC transporter permease DevC [Cognatiyoonia sp. IB215182]
MTAVLTWFFGRLPIGWLQLAHNRTRLIAAVAGVGFANLLVFVQLGILGALNGTTVAPYALFEADIMVSSVDANTLTDGSNVARQRLFQALAVPGVADGTPLFIANLTWQREDGTFSTLQTFGVDSEAADFLREDVAARFAPLGLEDRVLIDRSTRGLASGALDDVSPHTPFVFEANDRTLSAIGTVDVGGGFSADGALFVSDQTFMRLFGNRSPSAPNHILLKVDEGIDPIVIVDRLRDVLPAESVKVDTVENAAAADLSYQTTERPTGIIFGFGVLIGVLVGIVIVYQILATDVADHLKEYATFKAMGYGQPFFLGIVFEEAIILAVFGFVPGLLASLGLYAGLEVATGLPMEMTVDVAIMVLLGTLLACAISGAIATRRLVGADPADLF